MKLPYIAAVLKILLDIFPLTMINGKRGSKDYMMWYLTIKYTLPSTVKVLNKMF